MATTTITAARAANLYYLLGQVRITAEQRPAWRARLVELRENPAGVFALDTAKADALAEYLLARI